MDGLTAEELEGLRTLVIKVEEHGGPKLQDHVEGSNMCWTLSDGMDIAVGVLKRDLIERGVNSRVWVGNTHSLCELIRVYSGPERYGNKWIASEQGDTELHAVLKAWLSAAKAEGWTRD